MFGQDTRTIDNIAMLEAIAASIRMVIDPFWMASVEVKIEVARSSMP